VIDLTVSGVIYGMLMMGWMLDLCTNFQ
jgi:hypothetical protein